MNKKVVTRFAPSPTGYLHIGNARTALFAWLYARANGGKFKLRIEDTDRERYYPDAVKVIYRDLKWLLGGKDDVTLETDVEDGAVWDELCESQFARADRHREVAEKLIAEGKAYYCHLSKEKLDVMRDEARKNGGIIHSPYRGLTPEEARAKAEAEGDDKDPVVRLMVPNEGTMTLNDMVQGEVTVDNARVDDLVLLRANGTPIYHLSVVVDDYDAGVTHVIRGADHLNNAFKQAHIIKAMGWDVPVYAHLPLVTNMKGAKLSKRDADVALWDYKEKGVLSEAFFNYLLRLGWSHGEDEIISREKAIEWFGFDAIGKSSSKFDEANITHLNVNYLKEANDERVAELSRDILEKKLDRELTEAEFITFVKAMPELKNRVKSVVELVDLSMFMWVDSEHEETMFKGLDEKSVKNLVKPLKVGEDGEMSAKDALEKCISYLEGADWNKTDFNQLLCDFSNEQGFKLGKFLMIIRIAVCFSGVTPPFEVMELLGKDRIINRLKTCLKTCF
ncbi:MAG: glutamate--tRNA ligase [Alphaproteobacteria bacterium]|jgi:glutamyl-tRNA synthetase|nr:glutamate--tRNA ligase [Alphaproteobacteria bacterium]